MIVCLILLLYSSTNYLPGLSRPSLDPATLQDVRSQLHRGEPYASHQDTNPQDISRAAKSTQRALSPENIIKRGNQTFFLLGPVLDQMCREIESELSSEWKQAKEMGLVLFTQPPKEGERGRHALNTNPRGIAAKYMDELLKIPEHRRYISYASLCMSIAASFGSGYVSLAPPETEFATMVSIIAAILSIIASSEDYINASTIDRALALSTKGLISCFTVSDLLTKAYDKANKAYDAANKANNLVQSLKIMLTANERDVMVKFTILDSLKNKALTTSASTLISVMDELEGRYCNHLDDSSLLKRKDGTHAKIIINEPIADKLRHILDEEDERWLSHINKACTLVLISGLSATVFNVVWCILFNASHSNSTICNFVTNTTLLTNTSKHSTSGTEYVFSIFNIVTPTITGLAFLFRMWNLYAHHRHDRITVYDEALIQARETHHIENNPTRHDSLPSLTKAGREVRAALRYTESTGEMISARGLSHFVFPNANTNTAPPSERSEAAGVA